MDHTEFQDDRMISIDKDTQINVMVNRPDSDELVIDLGRVFQNAKKKFRIYIWVVLLFLAAGISIALLSYQLGKEPLTVSSVVTLDYDVAVAENAPATATPMPVTDLTAPDRTPLDLNQVTSAYVLQSALDGLQLSHPLSLSQLRANIRIDKILTEDSRRQQEIASNMIADKSTGAYQQVQEIELTYTNQFVVSLTNGFGEEDSRSKIYLTDNELRLVLDRVLDAYNDYLVITYADIKLPDDEISVIDTENLDLLESLDLLRSAAQNLYTYCDEKPDAIKEYRSWRTGLSLNNLLDRLNLIRDVNIEYLYSYVYTSSIVVDRQTILTNYQYDLRNKQTQLDTVNERIRTTQHLLDTYKNDDIYVTMQESDSSKSTRTTTDYYNELILQQADNLAEATALEIDITDLQDKIANLSVDSNVTVLDEARQELSSAVAMMQDIYSQIREQFQEITTSTEFTVLANHSVAQGRTESFLSASAKKMVIGAVAGLVIACGIWFVDALAPEFVRTGDPRKEDVKK